MIDSPNGINAISLTLEFNSSFSSYLSNINQFVTINGFNSETQSVRCGVLQGSILAPLLFLIYINDLDNATRFFQLLHLADDTCLLNIQGKIYKINKSLNKDLKELSFWLNANKISLNVTKNRDCKWLQRDSNPQPIIS